MKNTPNELRAALEQLAYLIESLAPESDFQKLFAKFPCILSKALPLRLSSNDIIPLGRPGITEPDFVYFADKSLPYPLCGIIEIKRPDSPVVVVPRKNVILLSTDARTAVEQCQKFTPDLHVEMRRRFDCAAFVGNEALNFVIMGLTQDLAKKLTEDWQNKDLATQIPANCRILTYDTVLKQFSKAVPERTLLLLPAIPSHKHSDSSSADTPDPDQCVNQIDLFPRLREYIQRTLGSDVSVIPSDRIELAASVGLLNDTEKRYDYTILVSSSITDSVNERFQFIVGHEYAHIVLGHLQKLNTEKSLDSEGTKKFDYQSTWELEAEADAFAARLLSVGEVQLIEELKQLAHSRDPINLTKQWKQDNSAEQEPEPDK